MSCQDDGRQADGRLLQPRSQGGQLADADSVAHNAPQGGPRANPDKFNPWAPKNRLGVRDGGVAKATTPKQGDKHDNRELRELARKYDRCYDCGMHCAPGTMAQHKQNCKKDKKSFASRLGRVRQWVQRGVVEYDKINDFSHAPAPAGKKVAKDKKPSA